MNIKNSLFILAMITFPIIGNTQSIVQPEINKQESNIILNDIPKYGIVNKNSILIEYKPYIRITQEIDSCLSDYQKQITPLINKGQNIQYKLDFLKLKPTDSINAKILIEELNIIKQEIELIEQKASIPIESLNEKLKAIDAKIDSTINIVSQDLKLTFVIHHFPNVIYNGNETIDITKMVINELNKN